MTGERENLSTASLAGRENELETDAVDVSEERTGLPMEANATSPAEGDVGSVDREPDRVPPLEATAESDEGENAALLPEDQIAAFRSRWSPLQATFVDDPSTAVAEADGLVAEVMQTLARSFADERSGLEARWKKGEDVSTEDLRVALQRYRSFFNRLLAA